ncbi:MAG: AAA family ATPase [Pseudomonadota bacterium]
MLQLETSQAKRTMASTARSPSFAESMPAVAHRLGLGDPVPDSLDPSISHYGDRESMWITIKGATFVDRLSKAEGGIYDLIKHINGCDEIEARDWYAKNVDAETVEKLRSSHREQKPAAQEQHQYGRHIEIIQGSTIKPEPINWLWEGWLARGKMHILGGAPGTGKTTIALSLAATITAHGRWPDGSQSITGNVVIWSGEDDPCDTLVPRLITSGADLDRIYLVQETVQGSERRAFDPAQDMGALNHAITKIGDVRLLIIDPIVSAVSGDSHKNAEVRRGLQPLCDLASSAGCALIGITHLTKGTGGRDPVERITGSLAFGALARVVLVAAKHQEAGDDGGIVRLFCRAKSNIGPDDGGFNYKLQQCELPTHSGVLASAISWGAAIDGSARELLATADSSGDDGEGGTLGDAKRFLTELLADGPVPSRVIKADADGAGHSWATIRRAKKELGIVVSKQGGYFGSDKQQWMWKLPSEAQKVLNNTERAQPIVMSTFSENEHLQQNSTVMEGEL